MSGVIRELSGTVELKMPGAASYVPAKTGDQLSQDTVVSTGFKSTALVAVGSTLITVRPLTRLTLAEIRASQGAETLNVNLQAGRVRVNVTPPAGTRTSVAVSSPIATASVRGTSFEFDTSNLTVISGTVSFHGKKGNPMMVSGGSGSRIGETGKAADPVTTGAGKLKPKAPAGADSSGVTPGQAPSHSTGVFTIDLDYSGSGG